MRLADKVAIVTGAGDGIGRGIALALAREGASVAVCDVNADTVAETGRLVAETGRQVAEEGRLDAEEGRLVAEEGRLVAEEGRPIADAGCTNRAVLAEPLDITDHGRVRSFVEDAASRFGKIDILVNNAAIMPVSPIEDQDEATMSRILSVNLLAPAVFSKYCTPHMRAAGGGSIIHMASVTGHNGHPGVAVYGATKGGLIALARGQAMELAADNIRVNTVSPGTVDSPMLHNFVKENAEDPEAALRAFDRLHPIGRIATIEEVANVFVFLASDESSDVTATDIRCDGGYAVQGRQPTE